MKNKRAAMEMSMGTVVTIVLLVTVLILGLVFVRKIMCSGIILTDQINEGMVNEIKGLFSVNDYGIKCMGEKGQDVKLGDGGKKQIFCVANIKSQAEYNLKIKNIESLKGAPTANVKNWVLDQDWSGTLSPGQDTVTVLVLDVPDKISETTLKIILEEENLDTGTKKTHTSYIDLTHVGGFTSAMC